MMVNNDIMMVNNVWIMEWFMEQWSKWP
jgi:hypothetical protein